MLVYKEIIVSMVILVKGKEHPQHFRYVKSDEIPLLCKVHIRGGSNDTVYTRLKKH